MLGQRSGRIILGNPEAGNATVIRLLQQPKGGAGYCDSLDILLQWNSAPFTAGDAIPLSIQIKGAGLVIRAFLSRFEIPRPRPSSKVGQCWDNAPGEAIWSSLKRETLIGRRMFSSHEAAAREATHWINIYNQLRPHSAIGMQIPLEYDRSLKSRRMSA